MLIDIQDLFSDDVSPHWASDVKDWGEWVALYRRYARGEHNVYLNADMKRMLNMVGKKIQSFSADYTDMVIRMMSERLVVERVEAVAESNNPTQPPSVSPLDPPQSPHSVGGSQSETEENIVDVAQAWVDRLLKRNRFDALQMDVHEATVRDGDAFVIVDFDDDKQYARFHFNEAYDGDVGVVPIYSRSNPHEMLAAVKVIYTGEHEKKAYVYTSDEVVEYITDGEGQGFTLQKKSKWMGKLPVVHFSNRRRLGQGHGISELHKMIPTQDVLNRLLVSMTMASEFTAFQTFFSKGFEVAGGVSPGMVITYNPNNKQDSQFADFKAIPPAMMTPFIEQMNKIIDLIAEITQTPIASVLGTNPSGEALKQRESGLLTKIRGAHVKFGNAWEDLLAIAHSVETFYKRSNKPPAIEMFDCKWKDASVRSDLEVTTIAGQVFDKLQDMPAYLEMVSDVTGWDEPKRQEILERVKSRDVSVMAGFDNSFGGSVAAEFASAMNGVVGLASAPSKI